MTPAERGNALADKARQMYLAQDHPSAPFTDALHAADVINRLHAGTGQDYARSDSGVDLVAWAKQRLSVVVATATAACG